MNLYKALFRYSFYFVCLTLLSLIFWSSIIKEEQLQIVQNKLDVLEKKVQHLSFVSKSSFQDYALPPAVTNNLLQKDPFYETVLIQELGHSFVPNTIRKEPLLVRPDNLHPFNNYLNVSILYNWCVPSLAKTHIGKYETWSPGLAESIELVTPEGGDTPCEFHVKLKENIFWSPLQLDQFGQVKLSSWFLQQHRVTAYDFKFYFDAIMNSYISEGKACVMRPLYQDIESFTVHDDQNFTVRWKMHTIQEEEEVKHCIRYTAKQLTLELTPLPCFVYQYLPNGEKIVCDTQCDYQTDSIWAQNFSSHFAKNYIVSCGPYEFISSNDQKIKLRYNPLFPDPYQALHEELHFVFKDTLESVWQDFKAGNLDLCYLSPNQVKDFENFLQTDTYQKQTREIGKIQSIEFVDKAYYYIGWNLKNPLFKDIHVRKALNLAIDKKRIIQQNLNQLALNITGPFFCNSPAYDSSVIDNDYNLTQAAQILTENGWIDHDKDGVREKEIDGKVLPFSFSLHYYSKNIMTKVICEFIASSLKDIGIDCRLQGVDITDLSRVFEDKSFDALYSGWALGLPPEDPRQLWHSDGVNQKGSSNTISFAHPKADQMIESLQYESNTEKRLTLYHQLHQLIHDQCPYTFLYSPKKILCYRDYIKNIFIPKNTPSKVPNGETGEPDLRIIYFDLR